ncbi:MAG: DMT family transporter [Muribaculaceae bacterium]
MTSNNSANHEAKAVTIWQRPVWVSLLALTAAVAWGWAYPLIKLGFSEFAIEGTDIGSKMLFAGIRFLVSGLIILAVARTRNCPMLPAKHKHWLMVLAFALVNTTLHYAFFYVGLWYSAGSRAAILNSMSVFVVVLLACVFFRSDRLTTRKIAGCAMGIAGIFALNIGGEQSGSFTLLGDGLIALNALCGAVASLMTRPLSRRIDIFAGTGYSLAIGGALLLIAGLACGGALHAVTLWGITILLMLIGISTIGFTLYNKLLSCNPVGKVAIFNSLIPVVGAVTSCLCLGEPFFFKYVIATLLASAGIYVINKGKM